MVDKGTMESSNLETGLAVKREGEHMSTTNAQLRKDYKQLLRAAQLLTDYWKSDSCGVEGANRHFYNADKFQRLVDRLSSERKHGKTR
jgi:hypothetical protein